MERIHPLTRYREREKLSKAELAARLDVSRAAITRYEERGRQIDRTLVSKFSEITGIPEAALAGYAEWNPAEEQSCA